MGPSMLDGQPEPILGFTSFTISGVGIDEAEDAASWKDTELQPVSFTGADGKVRFEPFDVVVRWKSAAAHLDRPSPRNQPGEARHALGIGQSSPNCLVHPDFHDFPDMRTRRAIAFANPLRR